MVSRGLSRGLTRPEIDIDEAEGCLHAVLTMACHAPSMPISVGEANALSLVSFSPFMRPWPASAAIAATAYAPSVQANPPSAALAAIAYAPKTSFVLPAPASPAIAAYAPSVQANPPSADLSVVAYAPVTDNLFLLDGLVTLAGDIATL